MLWAPLFITIMPKASVPADEKEEEERGAWKGEGRRRSRAVRVPLFAKMTPHPLPTPPTTVSLSVVDKEAESGRAAEVRREIT
jgi:hypothetical protein